MVGISLLCVQAEGCRFLGRASVIWCLLVQSVLHSSCAICAVAVFEVRFAVVRSLGTSPDWPREQHNDDDGDYDDDQSYFHRSTTFRNVYRLTAPA
jgi:hypothetical protein